jgi:hypothetical protein
MRLSLLAIAVIIAIAVVSDQAGARVQQTSICLESDIEFPVPCDDDD